MKILFITDNFYPETNAPAKRTLEHVKEWENQGHEITIITGNPNFPKGKLFPGYKNKIYTSEKKNNINIKRVWTYISPNKGFFLRIIDYLSFMISSSICGLFTKKHDIIIATSPQFFTLLSGYFVSIFKRTPLTVEIRDLWPESIVSVGSMRESNIIIKILHRIANYIYKNSKLIICVTNSFKTELIQKGVAPEKIFVIQNGFDLNKNILPTKSIKNIKEEHNIDKDYVVSFIGTVGMAHGLEIVLNASNKFNNNILFLIIGEGARKEELEKLANEKSVKNVRFISNLTWQEIINLNQVINLHLVHLIKNDEFLKVIPSKIFESMALRKPIIMGVNGESKEIVNAAKCGFDLEPEDAKGLARIINENVDKKDMLRILGNNGFNYLKENFSRKVLAIKMLNILKTAV